MTDKKIIYYARTFRRIQAPKGQFLLYMCILFLPIVLLWLHLDDLTLWICRVAASVLESSGAGIPANIVSKHYSLIGEVSFLEIGTVYPGVRMCLMNIGVAFIGVVLCVALPWRGRPMPIYMMLNFGIHLISSLWFLFGQEDFPYTLTQFSELYMLQEVGIWIVFFIMTAAVTGIVGTHGLPDKFLAVACVMIYSIVFGLVRFVVFMFLLYRYSILYMTLLYFTLGPLFDFIYLVMVYGFFVNRMIRIYESQKGKEAWRWS